MAKAKAPLEIRKAKQALEQRISDVLYETIMSWQRDHPGWMVTDATLGIIDVSTMNGRPRRMPAASVVEITRRDLAMKITKHGQVKELG